MNFITDTSSRVFGDYFKFLFYFRSIVRDLVCRRIIKNCKLLSSITNIPEVMVTPLPVRCYVYNVIIDVMMRENEHKSYFILLNCSFRMI